MITLFYELLNNAVQNVTEFLVYILKYFKIQDFTEF